MSRSRLPRFTDLTLILTERCNLRCSFCYVPKESPSSDIGRSAPARGGAREMPREVALRAVDFLVDRAPAGARLSLSFFGGEPFLARELMAEAMDRARERAPEITFGTPTNGTLVDRDAAQLIEDREMSIALSVDTIGGGEGHTLERLRAAGTLALLCSPLVRMTVTPDNVGQLFETIVTLSEQGLSRIMHQPALELPWPGPAVDLWRDQHQQLADWACRRYEDRQPLPDLTVLEGIVRRLEGQAATYCGAGVRIGAVTPDGKIYGCYRSAYDPRGDKMALGDIFGGPVNEPLVRAYAQLHPHRARPERGECRRCPARAGCTIFCPATGHVLCGDLRAVSATACALLREQVAVCDEILRRMRRIDRRRRRRRVGSHVAAAALAFSLAGGAAGCDDETSKPDGPVGGICPVQVDSALNDGRVDGPVGGVCPVQQPDGQILDGPQPGLCPVPPPDARAEGPQPGVCPIAPDLHPKPKKDGMPQPGFCPIMPDAMVGGVCPVPAPDGGHKPGLC